MIARAILIDELRFSQLYYCQLLLQLAPLLSQGFFPLQLALLRLLPDQQNQLSFLQLPLSNLLQHTFVLFLFSCDFELVLLFFELLLLELFLLQLGLLAELSLHHLHLPFQPAFNFILPLFLKPLKVLVFHFFRLYALLQLF